MCKEKKKGVNKIGNNYIYISDIYNTKIHHNPFPRFIYIYIIIIKKAT